MIPQMKKFSGYLNPNYIRKISAKGSPSLLVHQATSVLLFISCGLVSCIQYFGEPIQCVQDNKGDDATINERVMNNFCFISSTYTISEDGLGYGCGTERGSGINEGTVRRHSYYVWIPVVLFSQAFSFLIPYYCWRYCEGGLIRKLLNGVSGLGIDTSSDESIKKVDKVSEYFEKTLHSHGLFCFSWIFCDVVAIGIAIGNFLITDSLLGGYFWNYGSKIFWSDYFRRCSLEDAFPKLTKCTFYKFGSGGSLQNIDSLCVMALNVVNEKIYIILWFWFLILLPSSLLWFLLKMGVIIGLKCLSKEKLADFANRSWFRILIGCPNVKYTKCLSAFARRFSPSDWIFFSHLISGMRSDVYFKFSAKLEQLVTRSDD